jgi:hypothetical protein
MSVRIIVGIVFYGLAMIAIFGANMITRAMIGAINRKRQDHNLMSYFWFTPSKTLQIYREYRTSYPNGRLHIYEFALAIVALVSMITMAVCFRIIG